MLGAACLAWLPYRMNMAALGVAAPLFETLFTVIFVASALFLLAGAALLGGSARRLVRLGAWIAPLLLLLYARRWVDAMAAWLGGSEPARSQAIADVAEVLVRALPLAAAAVLIALALRSWRELEPAAA